MSVNEFFYKGFNIILQVYGEREFVFRGFVFYDDGNGMTSERVTCANAIFANKEAAFMNGFEYVKNVVDNNLLS